MYICQLKLCSKMLIWTQRAKEMRKKLSDQKEQKEMKKKKYKRDTKSERKEKYIFKAEEGKRDEKVYGIEEKKRDKDECSWDDMIAMLSVEICRPNSYVIVIRVKSLSLSSPI